MRHPRRFTAPTHGCRGGLTTLRIILSICTAPRRALAWPALRPWVHEHHRHAGPTNHVTGCSFLLECPHWLADPTGVSGHIALATVPPGHTTCLPEMRSMRSGAAPAAFRFPVQRHPASIRRSDRSVKSIYFHSERHYPNLGSGPGRNRAGPRRSCCQCGSFALLWTDPIRSSCSP